MRFLFVAALLVACSGHPKPSGVREPPAPREDGGIDVTLTTADGVKLAATHWVGPTSTDRCVVLVHQLGSTRDEWSLLIAKLRRHYEILSFDLRGHGDSRRGPHGDLSYRDFDSDQWAAAVLDIDAASRWLAERGYRMSDCALVGSSIGSSLAIRYAGAHEVGALIVLSPGLGYKNLAIADAAAKHTGPALVVYSGEPDMKTTVDQLAATWGDRAQLMPVDGTAHGVSMISDDEARLDAVVAFIAAALP